MFDWVPIYNYTNYFNIGVLLCILLIVWQCHTGMVLKKDTASLNGILGIFLTIFLIFYIGMRPISSVFGDTVNYDTYFRALGNAKSFSLEWDKEWLFFNIQNWCRVYADIHTLFLICSVIYVGSLWIACVRIFKNYYYVPLIVFFCMFTFWAYGVNGVRNGAAASLFILAITFINTPPIALAIAILGCGFHSTVYLMIGAAILAYFIKNSYYYLAGWITSIGLSYAAGGRIQSIIANIGILGEDDRLSTYLTTTSSTSIVGAFRWDFLAFSAIGVAFGYYFIFKRQYRDEFYHWIYNCYLTTNAFWVLVIRASFSNRFAQISWFILPLVVIYPFMKKRFWDNHEKMLAYAILLFYAYGFFDNIIRTNALRIFF